MALKKSNLSPEVKSRLRQAVLGEITHKAAPAKAKTAAAKVPVVAAASKPALKTLNKITVATPVITPIKAVVAAPKPAVVKAQVVKAKDAAPIITAKPEVAPAKAVKKTKAHKKAVAKVKKAASRTTKKKIKAVPAIKPPVAVKAVAPIVGVPKVAPAKSIYSKPRPVAKRDWELPQKPSQSLEALFSKPKSTISPSTGFFRKPASTSVRETKVVFPSAKLAKEKARKHWGGARILKFIGLIVLLLIVLLAFDIFGLYQLGFRDTVSYQVSQNLQLPAGSVNGSYIPLANYLSDVQLLNLPMSQKREGMFDYTDQTDIKAKIFYRLAALDIMTQKLTGYGKSVTMADMDNQVNLLLQQTGGKDQAEKIVGNLYGLNLAQFREKILGPMLLREGLQQAIINDETVAINKAAKDRADEVLKLAQVSSTDFAALAHQYSDDEASINTGGDLGWVIKGQLDQQWENLIFSGTSTKVLPQLVKSNFGYHIIKIEQRVVDPKTNVETVKLRHILVKVDIDKYIKELLDGAKLIKYIK